MTRLYYMPPSDEIFENLRSCAIDLWRERYPEDKSPYYAAEKIKAIEKIGNVGDNFMYIVAMFDNENQRLLADIIDMNTRIAVRERMVDGGHPSFLIHF